MTTSRRGPRWAPHPLNFRRKPTAPHEKRGWLSSALNVLVTASLSVLRILEPALAGHAPANQAAPQSQVHRDFGGAI